MDGKRENVNKIKLYLRKKQFVTWGEVKSSVILTSFE